MSTCPKLERGNVVLRTPQQVLRQCDRQVNKKAALLVGNGLTAAAEMKSPTVGNGAETGERVAKLEPLHRTSGGSCGSGGNAQVKDRLGMARSVHQRKLQVLVVSNREVADRNLRAELIEWILGMKNGNEKSTPQPDYAREALRHYHAEMPWLDLMRGVREAMK